MSQDQRQEVEEVKDSNAQTTINQQKEIGRLVQQRQAQKAARGSITASENSGRSTAPVPRAFPSAMRGVHSLGSSTMTLEQPPQPSSIPSPVPQSTPAPSEDAPIAEQAHSSVDFDRAYLDMPPANASGRVSQEKGSYASISGTPQKKMKIGKGSKIFNVAVDGGTARISQVDTGANVKVSVVAVGTDQKAKLEHLDIEEDVEVNQLAGERAIKILKEMMQKENPTPVQIEVFQQQIETLKQEIQVLAERLDTDEQTIQEMEEINANPQLKRYYETILRIQDSFIVARIIETGQVNQADDSADTTIKILDQIGRQIPIVGAITSVLAQGALAGHNVSKRVAMRRLTDWTPGIAEATYLARRFARKVTLAKKNEILNAAEPQEEEKAKQLRGFANRARAAGTAAYEGARNVADKAARKKRELYSGQSSSAEEELALRDRDCVLEAIMKGEIHPSAQDDSSMNNRLEQMLTVATSSVESNSVESKDDADPASFHANSASTYSSSSSSSSPSSSSSSSSSSSAAHHSESFSSHPLSFNSSSTSASSSSPTPSSSDTPDLSHIHAGSVLGDIAPQFEVATSASTSAASAIARHGVIPAPVPAPDSRNSSALSSSQPEQEKPTREPQTQKGKPTRKRESSCVLS